MPTRSLLRLAIVAALVLSSTARAAERTFVLKDYSGLRDWGPELVNYRLASGGGEFRQGQLALVDTQGRAVPFQLADVKSSGGFITEAKLSFEERDRPELVGKPVIKGTLRFAPSSSVGLTTTRAPSVTSFLAAPSCEAAGRRDRVLLHPHLQA